MTGDARGMRRVAASVWRVLVGRPVTWRQALVQAFTTGVAFIVVAYWLGVVSFRDDPWFGLWWLPLWLASSMLGYALWRGRRRDDAAYREPYPRG